jgi:hypothetical protein
MFMPKKALSVTLEEGNLIWLKGRAAATKRRSLSEALDALITSARTGGHGATDSRSVVGTIDIAPGDPTLEHAGAYVQSVFDASLQRPFIARETPPTTGSSARQPRKPRRG